MPHHVVLRSDCSINGSRFLSDFTFECGHTVPVYEINATNAFNQLIGYAKYTNKEYGNVYYRGIDYLYDNVRPSIMRGRIYGEAQDLNDLINKIREDEYLAPSLKLLKTLRPQKVKDYNYNDKIKRINKYIIEGMLQHYCGITRFIDVVNNHWVALWMGLHKFTNIGEGGCYVQCVKREFSTEEILERFINQGPTPFTDEELKKYNPYVYILLMGMPYSEGCPMMGVTESEELVEVDLRKALPSFYLRPHAQHALVIRKKEHGQNSHDAKYYDMAQQTIGILRVRIDLADKWLGNGLLVSKENLFPSPSVDQGYNGLLKNKIFKDLKHPKIKISKYY